MEAVLIISDNYTLCEGVSRTLLSAGFTSKILKSYSTPITNNMLGFDVAIFDINLAKIQEKAFYEKFIGFPDRPHIIIVTDNVNLDYTEYAIRSGAWDYFFNPPDFEKIKVSVQRAVKFWKGKKSQEPKGFNRCGIIGTTPTMMACFDIVTRTSYTNSNILITGETGTGKELFARAIHLNSIRHDQPFIMVDCASLPCNLVESILFGHEKGAFTTADVKHTGLIQQAHKGTLFLDEVGELPTNIQKSFLRVLQERKFRPVGGIHEIFSNFRLVAATNRNLEKMVREKSFRQDLFFRLQTITLDIPPLRGHTIDINELTYHFIKKYSILYDQKIKNVSDDFMESLREYDWPGNVRELINAIEHAITSSANESMLYPEHLPTNIRIFEKKRCLMNELDSPQHDFEKNIKAGKIEKFRNYKARSMADIESRYIASLLRMTCGDIKKSCSISGLSRARLYALIKKYDMFK
jgi:two-component system, NtrC family, response regulator